MSMHTTFQFLEQNRQTIPRGDEPINKTRYEQKYKKYSQLDDQTLLAKDRKAMRKLTEGASATVSSALTTGISGGAHAPAFLNYAHSTTKRTDDLCASGRALEDRGLQSDGSGGKVGKDAWKGFVNGGSAGLADVMKRLFK